ncbi:MAG: glutamate--tRNA ligase [Clostridia bacterium]|nr:glutamate--tRNA ligase [Clostridia bacterium]
MRVRTRFAPSPTGFMHIGNLRTALYAYLYAKNNDGDFILRIEDTDQERYVEGAVEFIYSILNKAGITHDEGPDKDGGVGPYIQSERKPIYLEYAKKLIELGGAYYCFCDKERLDSLADGNGIKKYDKHCLKLSKEEIEAKLNSGCPYVIRQNVPTEGMTEYEDMVFGTIKVPCEDLEDGVLIKSDGLPTYNFANVVDDHLMKISHVMRGIEYLSSTPKYNLMYDCFGWERPKYMHLPPIMKDAQKKLSKRYGDANFEDFIAKGFLPEAIVNYIALLGWSPKGNEEKMTMEDLIKNFDVDGISHSSSIFDETKMKWLNGLYIREMSEEDFLAYATPYFDKSVINGKYDYSKFAKLLQNRIEIFSEIPAMVEFIDNFGEYDLELFYHKKMKTDKDVAKVAINYALEIFNNVENFDETTLHDAMIAKCEEVGMKKGQMLFTVRVALTGCASTPGGAVEMAGILGKEESIRRLNYSLSLIG